MALDTSTLTPEQLEALRQQALNNSLVRGGGVANAPGQAARIAMMGTEAAASKPGRLQPIANDAAVAPTLQDTANAGAPEPAPLQTERLQPLNYKQRQNLPLSSPGVTPGTSQFEENRIQRIEDQKANPWGSAENHPGFGGRLAHIAAKVGNVAGDILDPAAMARIPGTELHRDLTEQAATERLGTDLKNENTQANERANQARADKDLALRTRHEEFEEGKPEKPGTVDQEAVNAKMQEVNPDTKKPYTAYEARVALAQAIQDTKPVKPEAAPKTITMLDAPGGKPYEYQYDPKGNYSGDEGHGNWKKIGPAQPNALSLGIVGTMQPLLNPDGSFSGKTFNNKTGKLADIDTSGLGGATTSSGARLANTERNQFATAYVKPATDIEQNYQKFIGARKEYDANPQTGAASMAALAQHLGSTFGSIKGAQMGEHMVQEHKDAIGFLDRIDRYVDQLKTGQQLSKAQWDDFQKLITNTREIQWQTTAHEAARRHQPVDFLPADVHVQMADSKGNVRFVTGDKVQGYLDQGATIR